MNLNNLRLQSVESYRNANVFLCFLRQISMAGVPEFSILRRNLQWGTVHYSGISPDAGLLTWLMRSMFSLLYTLRLMELVTSRTVTDLGHHSGLGNGQAPVWCQAITWTKYYLFVNWTDIYNEIQTTILVIAILVIAIMVITKCRPLYLDFSVSTKQYEVERWLGVYQSCGVIAGYQKYSVFQPPSPLRTNM